MFLNLFRQVAGDLSHEGQILNVLPGAIASGVARYN
jgi:hypothetical protein